MQRHACFTTQAKCVRFLKLQFSVYVTKFACHKLNNIKMHAFMSAHQLTVLKFLLQLTGEAMYEPIVFLKQPYLLQGSLSFGNKNETTTTLLENPTKISFELFADILQHSQSAYEKITGTEHCPREVLKFSPPPQNPRCDQSIYRDVTNIHDYGFNVSFHNVSSLHFICSINFIFKSQFRFFTSSTECRMAQTFIDSFGLFCHVIVDTCWFVQFHRENRCKSQHLLRQITTNGNIEWEKCDVPKHAIVVQSKYWC